MLIVFFNIHGIVYREFVPQGQTINTKFYYEVLQWICGAQRIGFSTTTMHLVTEHSSFVSFSPTTT
jgi:hypothetical protein